MSCCNFVARLLRCLPTLTPDSYVRQGWERRQVAFPHSQAAVIDRTVALRLVEEALDRVARLIEDQRTVQQFAVQADAVDDLYRRLAGANFTAATATNEIEAVAENLRAQHAFLSEVQR